MLVHATRKSISEAGDNLTDDEKDSVESSTVKLEEAIKQDSLEAIEESTKNLNEVLTPLTQKLYPQAEEGSSDGAEETSSDENTVDAEFEEVKEEEK
jgi:molecular chaperone DnaK